jgi:hypothetical protein
VLVRVLLQKTYETKFRNECDRSIYVSPGRSRERPGVIVLILLLAGLFTIAFPRQGLLHTAFFAGLQIKGVPFNFLDDVLLLDLPFEAAQGIFKRFALL